MWSTLLLAMIVLASAVLLVHLVSDFIADDNNDYELRLWAYHHYGTASRSMWTMFQATLSGGWPNYARKLVENVNPLFALFWVAYVVVIVFAVMRVMSALFLASTMKAANQEEAMLIMKKMESKDK